MANPSISIDDEVLDTFDKIREAKEESLGDEVTIARSAVIQQLMEDWIEENSHYIDEQGNVDGVVTAD